MHTLTWMCSRPGPWLQYHTRHNKGGKGGGGGEGGKGGKKGIAELLGSSVSAALPVLLPIVQHRESCTDRQARTGCYTKAVSLETTDSVTAL